MPVCKDVKNLLFIEMWAGYPCKGSTFSMVFPGRRYKIPIFVTIPYCTSTGRIYPKGLIAKCMVIILKVPPQNQRPQG